MSNIIQINSEYSESQVELIKRTLLDKSCTTDELSLFIHQAKRTGLDPFTRQIYATKIGGKMTVQATIDGLRLIAERSGKYQGQTKPEWCGEDGVWKDVWLTKTPPSAARIGVFKEGFKEPTYAIALFNEYAQKNGNNLGFMWAKMPALMIAKVAEALALRKAFPNDLSGIYSTEEISGEVIDLKAEKIESKQEVKTELPQDLGKYIVKVGKKYAGMTLEDMKDFEIDGYVKYIKDGWVKNNQSGDEPNNEAWKEFVEVATKYRDSQKAKAKAEIDPPEADNDNIPF